MRRLVLALLLVTCFAAADWPRFRGPNADGLADPDTPGPITWTATENVTWKAPAPFGASSPVTKGDKIYLTGYTGYGMDTDDPGDINDLVYHVACYNRTDGSIEWSKAIRPARSPETPYRSMAALHGYAAPTCAVDDQQVYAFFGNSGVYALTLDGRPLWHADVGENTHNWNCGASPILWNDLVIVNASVESESVVALDKRTGRRVWTVPNIIRSWATPLVVDVPGAGQELVISLENKAIGVDPASGEVLWNCASVEDYVCPSVIAHDDIAYITGGRGPTFLAIKLGGRGDVTATHKLWQVSITPKVSTPIYLDGYLYFIDQTGKAVCLNADNGETVWREDLDLAGRRDRVYSSLVHMGGALYGFSREDGCVVLAAKPEFELLAKNSLNDSSIFNATPVVDLGQLLIRSDRFLYCLEKE